MKRQKPKSRPVGFCQNLKALMSFLAAITMMSALMSNQDVKPMMSNGAGDQT